MAEQTPLEAFRLVLGGTARAMAHDQELDLSFTAEAPSFSLKQLRVPMPARNLPPQAVAEARGFADSFALRARHHDQRIHERAAPAEPVARAVHDAVENARIEAIGARAMAGVRDNLNHALDVRLRSDPLVRARVREEVPLSTAIGLLVRERLTGQPAPAIAEPGLALVRDWIEDKAGKDLDALPLAFDDQAAFAKLIGRLLEDLELTQGDQAPETDPESGENDEGEDQEEGEGEE